MFVHYYAEIGRPFSEIEPRLLDVLASMDVWAAAAYRKGEEIRARIGVGGERALIAKQVRLRIRDPLRGEISTIVPLSWEATGTPGLFPTMDADLVLAALGAEPMAQLTLQGSYQPPIGALGRLIDRSLLHRIAEASVKHFVDRVARALEADPETVASDGRGGIGRGARDSGSRSEFE